MEETQIVQPTVLQPLDLTQPLPELLQQFRTVIDNKRAQKFGAVADIANELQVRGKMSKRTAFRLLAQMISNKPPRKVTAFLLALQALGYTVILAEVESGAISQPLYPPVLTDKLAP
ncbi:MAG: hypothetical protein WCV85_04410 [Patescibacteria group bacterium]|jgi:hypothetical protein